MGIIHFKGNVTSAIEWFFIILSTFPLSLRMHVTSASSKTLCNDFKKARPSATKCLENLKNILQGGRQMTRTKHFSDYRLTLFKCFQVIRFVLFFLIKVNFVFTRDLRFHLFTSSFFIIIRYYFCCLIFSVANPEIFNVWFSLWQ